MKITILLLAVILKSSRSCILQNSDLQSEQFIIHLTRVIQSEDSCESVIFRNVSGIFDGYMLSPPLEDITKLKITESNIDSVSNLCSFPYLRKLTINNNIVFPKLDDYLLEDCDLITILEISDVEIEETALNTMGSLQILNMERISLNFLSKEFLEPLKNLVQLRIAESRIPHVRPGVLCCPPNLIKLNLKDNTRFPDLTIALLDNCNKLTSFIVSGNGETLLDEDALNTMSHLGTLYINNFKIEHLTRDYFRAAENLVVLDLNENSMKNIASDAFSNLKNLEMLNIKYSDLEKFQEGTFNALESLKVLDLTGNKIRSIKNIKGMKYLRRLDISWNKIFDIDVDKLKDDLPGLSQLRMFGNSMICEDKKWLSMELESKVNVDFEGIFDGEGCQDD